MVVGWPMVTLALGLFSSTHPPHPTTVGDAVPCEGDAGTAVPVGVAAAGAPVGAAGALVGV